MKVHMKRTGMLGVAITLTGVLAGGAAYAAPAPEAHGDAVAAAKSAMSEEEFVAKAMEVAGLSEKDARDAYHDPEMVLTVPVKVVAEDTAVSRTTAGLPVASASAGACELTSRRDHNNLVGWRLFRYTVVKYWEGTGPKVRNVSHEVSHSTTRLGYEGFWSFHKTTESVNDYRSWKGITNGRHYSARTGQWKAVPFEHKNLQVRTMTRADGSWTTDLDNTGDCW